MLVPYRMCTVHCALCTMYVYHTYTLHSSLTLSRVEQARSVKRPALPASARLARPACKTSWHSSNFFTVINITHRTFLPEPPPDMFKIMFGNLKIFGISASTTTILSQMWSKFLRKIIPQKYGFHSSNMKQKWHFCNKSAKAAIHGIQRI